MIRSISSYSLLTHVNSVDDVRTAGWKIWTGLDWSFWWGAASGYSIVNSQKSGDYIEKGGAVRSRYSLVTFRFKKRHTLPLKIDF